MTFTKLTLSVLLLTATLAAQVDQARLTGSVRDSSGGDYGDSFSGFHHLGQNALEGEGGLDVSASFDTLTDEEIRT